MPKRSWEPVNTLKMFLLDRVLSKQSDQAEADTLSSVSQAFM